MAARLKALVIGGGIGGLAAVLGLRRAGWDVDVFERTPELKEVGAGLTLWVNALKAHDRLDLGEAVRAYAVPEAAGGFRTWQGELLMSSTTGDLQRRFGDVTVMIHRTDLHTLLFQAPGKQQVHRLIPKTKNSWRSAWINPGC